MNQTLAFRLLLPTCLAFAGWIAPRAEVSVVLPSDGAVQTTILASIGEDSDPVGVWKQLNPLPPNQVLNPDGDLRGDGRPDIAFPSDGDPNDPVSTWPTVVWAYNAGADFDIAFAEWKGSGWSGTEFLTFGTENEVDPRVFVEADGTVHVVWWTDGVEPEVYLVRREAGANVWGSPSLVTDGAESGRRPSVAVFDGELRVAYERDSTEPGMAQDVMVATRKPTGAFVLERVASTVRTERLDPMIHAAAGQLWLEWKHVPGEFGSAVYEDEVWVGNDPEDWTDPSWIGVEDARKRIRAGVMREGMPGSQPPAE